MEKKTPKPKTPANNAGSGVVDDRVLTEFEMPADPMQRDILEIAELFRRSDWFGELTTVQLATLIFIGEGLGLSAGQAVFDLTVSPGDADTGPTITYRGAKTYEAAGDAIDAQRAGIRPESGKKRQSGEKTNVADRPTLEPASPPASNVVPLRKEQTGDDADLGPRSEAAANAEPGVTDPKAEPEDDAAKAESQLGCIVSMLREMDYKETDIRTRKETFAAADPAGKQKMFDDCVRFYDGKVESTRKAIVDRLSADGKKSADQQTGFYLYADVPTDPNEWTFVEAKKATAALENFLKRK